jgi:hypothetical protein
MKAPRGAALVALAVTLLAGPADAATLSGRVRDRDGNPVELASVSIASLKRGAVTDADGHFTLDVPPGRVSLEVVQMGYQRARLEVDVADAGGAVEVVLREEPVPIAEVSVAASSFGKSGKSEGAVVRRMDVLTTPGGAADLFQALRALPGINAPNEGAAVYIRGGDPHETLIRVDGGDLGHPYHYENASGGLFSTLDTYMLKSAFFSSGGFSAKYGGVLSGVLDIETQDPLNLRTVSVGANLVGTGLSSSWALVPDKLSLVGSTRYSNPALLFKLYGSSRDYESAPLGTDGVGRLLYRYSPTGRLALSWFQSGDQVAVTAERLNFEGTFRQSTDSRLAMLNFSDVLAGQVALRAQLSGQFYDTQWSFGPYDLSQTERNAQLNLDGVWPIGTRNEVSFGVNQRHRDTEITGTAAADSTDYQNGAPTAARQIRARTEYPGVYVEDKLRVWGPLYATLGVRADYASRPGVWTADPRAAVAWRVDEHQTVRVATGRYHQLASPTYLDPVRGNPDLGPPSATHVIAGYEWKSDYGNVRLEAFRKDYRDLVTQEPDAYFGNRGHGFARGVDLFVQGTHRWLSGWLSYGYLDSKRKQLDDPREVPASFGVRHTLTLVAQYQATSTVQLGAKYNVASGPPFTPVVAATYDPTRDLWRPVYGDHNSDQMPTYNRLDLRVTKLFSLPATGRMPASSVCVLYAEAMNVLGLHNTLEYAYNDDYTQRRAIDSYFSRRMVVAGVGLTW